MADAILKAAGICKKSYFAPGVSLDLLRNVSFSVYRGQFIALTGPSGAGKTTLLKILSGFEKDWDGEVLVNGMDIGAMREDSLRDFRMQTIGCCFISDKPLLKDKTVGENIGAKLKSLGRYEAPRQTEEILHAFALDAIKKEKAADIGLHECYRLLLALAFCGWRPIVMIDELPDYFTGDEQTEIMDTICTLQKAHKTTIILITAALEIIKRADRALYIRDERIHEVDLEKLRSITGA